MYSYVDATKWIRWLYNIINAYGYIINVDMHNMCN